MQELKLSEYGIRLRSLNLGIQDFIKVVQSPNDGYKLRKQIAE